MKLVLFDFPVRAGIACALAGAVFGCTPQRGQAPAPDATATPVPTATPTGPVYIGNPATHFRVEQVREGISPDGRALWRLTVHFFDHSDAPTRIMANSDVSWLSHDGYVQWQTRMRYGQPSALLSTDVAGPVAMTVRVNAPPLGSVDVRDDTRAWPLPHVAAAALGPHLVQIGWFPRSDGPVRVRAGGRDIVGAGASFVRDAAVQPGRTYRYDVAVAGRVLEHVDVAVPAELPAQPVANVSGKGMWLAFSTNPIDDDYAGTMHPQALADQAAAAGLHYVELRLTYGAYSQLAPDVKATIDALIDALSDRGIVTIAWSVPRDTSFGDISASTASALYRTPRGTAVGGIAVDLERGDMFMGGDPSGTPALATYVHVLRQALGPRALIVATVEDPFFEHLDNASYPYAAIARDADVMQPMAYWRMMRKSPTTAADVRALIAQSVARVRALSGRRVAVSVGGQTGEEGSNGRPSADELVASLDAARSAATLGECFFDWDGTLPEQWEALGRYRWDVTRTPGL